MNLGARQVKGLAGEVPKMPKEHEFCSATSRTPTIETYCKCSKVFVMDLAGKHDWSSSKNADRVHYSIPG